jgi:hypothetical protein
MEMLILKPAVYLWDCEEWVNLGELAKIVGQKPAELWEEQCFILADHEDKELLVIPAPIAPRMEISSLKTEGPFYMDSKGNVVGKNGQKTGFCINGPEGETVGGWEDVFVPLEWADEVISICRENDLTWEEIHS